MFKGSSGVRTVRVSRALRVNSINSALSMCEYDTTSLLVSTHARAGPSFSFSPTHALLVASDIRPNQCQAFTPSSNNGNTTSRAHERRGYLRFATHFWSTSSKTTVWDSKRWSYGRPVPRSTWMQQPRWLLPTLSSRTRAYSRAMLRGIS